MLDRGIRVDLVHDRIALCFPAPGDKSSETLEAATSTYALALEEILTARKKLFDRVTTRRELVDDKPIIVLDNVLDESSAAKWFSCVSTLPYRLVEYDHAGDQYPICSHDFNTDEFLLTNELGRWIRDLVVLHFPRESHVLTRCYVNLLKYGDVAHPHSDASPLSKNVTALLYVTDAWDHRYGGETKFYDSRDDTRVAVLPKSGRLALFRGSIQHNACVPARICVKPRFTLAMKFRSLEVFEE
jgi:hypothetical protein